MYTVLSYAGPLKVFCSLYEHSMHDLQRTGTRSPITHHHALTYCLCNLLLCTRSLDLGTAAAQQKMGERPS